MLISLRSILQVFMERVVAKFTYIRTKNVNFIDQSHKPINIKFIQILPGEEGESKEKATVEEKKEEDEIDPLDAYMQEVQQVRIY